MREFAARGAEPMVIATPAKPRSSWWTVAESGAAFKAALAHAQARIAGDTHIKMPDLSHLRDMRRGGKGTHRSTSSLRPMSSCLI